jgi:hypothetical protein
VKQRGAPGETLVMHVGRALLHQDHEPCHRWAEFISGGLFLLPTDIDFPVASLNRQVVFHELKAGRKYGVLGASMPSTKIWAGGRPGIKASSPSWLVTLISAYVITGYLSNSIMYALGSGTGKLSVSNVCLAVHLPEADQSSFT